MVFYQISDMDLLVAFQFEVFMQQVQCVYIRSSFNNRFDLGFDDVREHRYQCKSSFETMFAEGFKCLKAGCWSRHIWFKDLDDLIVQRTQTKGNNAIKLGKKGKVFEYQGGFCQDMTREIMVL